MHFKKMGFVALAAVFALMASLVFVSGCSPESETENNEEQLFSTESTIDQISIPVKVISPAVDNQVSYDDVVTIGEGSTALDVLQATGLEMYASQEQYGMFVRSLNGLDTEGTKGWTFTVNGEQVQKSADLVYLEDGDVVEWSYIDMAE